MNLTTSFKAVGMALLLVSSLSQAAVVMNGSRIIMEGTTEKTINFDNTSENPFIVQIEPENNAKPDFVAMPPIFKIKEKGGQVVKIKLLSSHLPEDKESLFYFNFTQIPGLKRNEEGNNLLNIVIKSTLKIIYRPKSVNAFSPKQESKISYQVQDGKLTVHNDTPNILSIRDISDGKHVLAEKITLTPGNTFSTAIRGNHINGPLKAVMINDYGTPVNFIIAGK